MVCLRHGYDIRPALPAACNGVPPDGNQQDGTSNLGLRGKAALGTNPFQQQLSLGCVMSIESRELSEATSESTMHVPAGRSYEVTFIAREMPIGLKVLTFPYVAWPELRESLYAQTPFEDAQLKAALLGLQIDRGIGRDDLRKAVVELLEAALIDFDVSYTSEEVQSGVHQLLSGAFRGEFIPLETSPLGGHNLGDLVGNSSFIGAAITISAYAIAVHNPLIFLVTPVGVILLGAATGAAEGLRNGIRDSVQGFIKSLQRKPIRRRRRSPKNR